MTSKGTLGTGPVMPKVLSIKIGQGWPVGEAMADAQENGIMTQVVLDGQEMGWIVPGSTLAHLRERVGELSAENARLRGEIDQIQADHHVIHVKAAHLQQAMAICREEEPGTILRETDERRRDYVLGRDNTWTAR